ncbi:MAG: tRNA pseudouridine(38-40) synthase TruA, partial [Opitutales bacterium]|nr:tRNA pseudouridine(38-40) synthase TruA [Opitutales bacterium]
HAKAQVFHFDAAWAHSAQNLLSALRCGLPAGIQIFRVARAKEGFHARYSAVGKRYVYNIYEGYAPPYKSRYCWSLGRRKLDVKKMNEAAAGLLGEHDFTAFSANRGHEEDNPVKNLRLLKVSRRGREIKISTEGSGYLYKMVRIISGALVDVGLGKLSAAEIRGILEGKKRTNLIQTAPSCGLFLEKVFY